MEKRIPKFSRSFKDIVYGIPMVIPLILLLIVIKKAIVQNDFLVWYKIYIYYGWLIFINFFIFILPFIIYDDYKNLVKKNLTTPETWKRNYVLILPITAVLISLLITFFLQ